MSRWCTVCTDLTDTGHPGNEQLAKELVLHRHLREEVVDFVILAVSSALIGSDHICKHKAGLCHEHSRRGQMKTLVKSCQSS